MIKYVIQGFYSREHAWEDLTTEETREEGRARLYEYNDNEREYRHRLIKRVPGKKDRRIN